MTAESEKEPRLAPIPIDEWDDDTKALLGANPVINIFATLAMYLIPVLMKRNEKVPDTAEAKKAAATSA